MLHVSPPPTDSLSPNEQSHGENIDPNIRKQIATITPNKQTTVHHTSAQRNKMIIKTITLLATVATSLVSATHPPIVGLGARVKQHRAGAQGDLVSGEEDLLKIIINWEAVDGAEKYEVCHNCVINDATGKREGDDSGTLYKVAADFTCGGRPCHVLTAAPRGKNRYNVRVSTEGYWSKYSEHRNFNVAEAGNVQHEHHEL